MKAKRDDDAFKPVTLTLETQHEVDAIFAVLNHAPLCDEVLQLPGDDWEELKNMTSPDASEIHNRISKALKDPIPNLQ